MSDKEDSKYNVDPLVSGAKPVGKRGRRSGSVQKYSGKNIIATYEALTGSDYLAHLIGDMITARNEGDRRVLQAYHAMLSKYTMTEVESDTGTLVKSQLSYEELVIAAKLAISAFESTNNDPSIKQSPENDDEDDE